MPSLIPRLSRLTNSWELLSEHHVQNAGPTNLSFHQHHTGVIGHNLTDDDRSGTQRMLVHLANHVVRRFSRDDRHQLAFVGDIERIEAEYFASALNRLAHRNVPLLQ